MNNCIKCLPVSIVLLLASLGLNAQHWFSLNNQHINNSLTFDSIAAPALQVFEPAKELKNGVGILVIPGGGYRGLAWSGEGPAIARAFNSLGLTCFVLKYRLPNIKSMPDFSEVPFTDAQAALNWIKQRAQQYHLDTAKIGVIGFSAGGHLAATLGNRHRGNLAFQILVYPVISMQNGIAHEGSRTALIGADASQKLKDFYSAELQINTNTPPTYITHTGDDKVVAVQNSINMYQALLKQHISTELHLYPEGNHGFIKKLPVNDWLVPMSKFLERNGIIPSSK